MDFEDLFRTKHNTQSRHEGHWSTKHSRDSFPKNERYSYSQRVPSDWNFAKVQAIAKPILAMLVKDKRILIGVVALLVLLFGLFAVVAVVAIVVVYHLLVRAQSFDWPAIGNMLLNLVG